MTRLKVPNRLTNTSSDSLEVFCTAKLGRLCSGQVSQE